MKSSPLVVMAQKCSSFRSGTCLNFWQRLIYSGISLKLEDIANHSNERNTENPAKWVVSALIYVPPIESVRKTKLIHHQALKLVKCLCEEVVKIDYLNAAEIFTDPLRNATCLAIHEIVEEILESFPSGILLRSEKNQSLFHLAIVYRLQSHLSNGGLTCVFVDTRCVNKQCAALCWEPSTATATLASSKCCWCDFTNAALGILVSYEDQMLIIKGFVMNVQPSEAEAGFDIRFSLTTDPDLLKKKIADEWASASRNMTFEVCNFPSALSFPSTAKI
ncbi:hypothetical protein Vadar_023530 [Vaccinium darrowii]|nr:hypothetical protein Vadar_023530 [Vaccinium darrowii]